jgi:hypothetical protein
MAVAIRLMRKLFKTVPGQNVQSNQRFVLQVGRSNTYANGVIAIKTIGC